MKERTELVPSIESTRDEMYAYLDEIGRVQGGMAIDEMYVYSNRTDSSVHSNERCLAPVLSVRVKGEIIIYYR